MEAIEMAPTQEGPPGLNPVYGQEPGDSDSEENLRDQAGVQVQAGAGGDSPLQENVKQGGSCNRTAMIGWVGTAMVTILSLVAVVTYQHLANEDLLAQLRLYNNTMTAQVTDMKTTLENIETKIESKIDNMTATQNEMDGKITNIEKMVDRNYKRVASGFIPKDLEGKVEFRLIEGKYAFSKMYKNFEEAKVGNIDNIAWLSYIDCKNTSLYFQTLCQRLQMRLPTIESAEENNIIHQWIKGRSAWIGLKKTDGLWMWQDGGNSTYRNWQEGYPKERDCAYMEHNNGKWYDWICTRTSYVLCEE